MTFRITSFTPRQIELLEFMEKNDATAREQRIYSPFAFYLNVGHLRKYGLIKEIQTVNGENRKSWTLSENGTKFMKQLRKLEEILDGGKDMVPTVKQ